MLFRAASRSVRGSMRRFNQTAAPVVPPSLVPAGTPLKIQVKKSGKEAVALADEEYPPWLWTLLDQAEPAAASENATDSEVLALLRRERKRRAKAAIKADNFARKMRQ